MSEYVTMRTVEKVCHLGLNVLVKSNDIWNKIKKMLGIKFHSKPVHDEKYIKTKVKAFNGVVHTIFWGDKFPKEGLYYTFIAAINIDTKMDKKNYPQVYLEECIYEIKKKKNDSDSFDV